MSPEDRAARWVVRRDQGPLSPQEEADFALWLHDDPRNETAWAKASDAWDIFEGTETDSKFASLRQEALRAGRVLRGKYWIPVGAGIAASIAAALMLLPGTALEVSPRPHSAISGPGVIEASETSYATRKGELRVIKLPDGSKVTLNTETSIELAFSSAKRVVRLVRGQALFEVAKNRARPFVVEAGGRRVTAVGTIFEVRLDPGRVKVLLVEGRVVVDRAEGAPSDLAVQPTVLRPGQELLAELGAAQKVASTDVTSDLLWRDGYIEFHDEPLGEAVAEINRYSEREIEVRDPRISSMRLSGVFRTGDPQHFATLVGELLPVTSRRGPDGKVEMVAAN